MSSLSIRRCRNPFQVACSLCPRSLPSTGGKRIESIGLTYLGGAERRLQSGPRCSKHDACMPLGEMFNKCMSDRHYRLSPSSTGYEYVAP
jgi:hypothetical protein